jgi:shikimate dehydrogenase
MPFSIDTYAVVGNPIAQSKSPLIHQAFAKQFGHEIQYLKLLVPTGEFAQTIEHFRALGGKGINITAPCKLDAFAYADQHSPDALIAGAVNCLHFTEQGAEAHNFDGVGLLRDIENNLGVSINGKRLLVLGAGGATRGLMLPFAKAEPASFTVVNRTLAKAEELYAELSGQVDFSICGYEDLKGAQFDVVLNATSASLTQSELPLPAGLFAANALAYELVYGKGLTPFLKQAQAQGVSHIADGVGMLAEQAAEAYLLWRGLRPSTPAVIDMLRVPLN